MRKEPVLLLDNCEDLLRFAQLSDTVIALERDQQDPSKRDTTTVRVLKNRHSGEVGIANELTYHLDTCTFEENEVTPDFDPSTDFG